MTLALLLAASLIAADATPLEKVTTRCTTLPAPYGPAADRQLVGCSEEMPENLLWNLDRADNSRDGFTTRVSRGKGAVVYVVDTGVEASHDEFQRDGGSTNVIAGLDPTFDLSDAPPSAACLDDSAVHPCFNTSSISYVTHGTAVASVVAGRTVGVAPDASIVSVRVQSERPMRSGTTFEDLWIRTLERIVEHAFDPATPPFRTAVVNLSSSPGYGRATDPGWIEFQRRMKLMIDGVDAGFQPAGDGKRFLFVVFAGNNIPPSPFPNTRGQCTAANDVSTYPAAAAASIEGLITVGGLDRQDQEWSGACSGAAVELLAPAEAILCASTSGHDRYRGSYTFSGGTVLDMSSGTSYATPYVSGLAARMLEKEPDLTPVEIERRLKDTASRIATPNASAGGRVPILREGPGPPRRRAVQH
jgi:subtilisin family serine protease